jgi:hypothetical protein
MAEAFHYASISAAGGIELPRDPPLREREGVMLTRELVMATRRGDRVPSVRAGHPALVGDTLIAAAADPGTGLEMSDKYGL